MRELQIVIAVLVGVAVGILLAVLISWAVPEPASQHHNCYTSKISCPERVG